MTKSCALLINHLTSRKTTTSFFQRCSISRAFQFIEYGRNDRATRLVAAVGKFVVVAAKPLENGFRNDAAGIHGSSATRSNVWHGQQMVSIFLRYVFVGRNVNITPAVIVRAGQPEKRFQFVDHDGRLCTSID